MDQTFNRQQSHRESLQHAQYPPPHLPDVQSPRKQQASPTPPLPHWCYFCGAEMRSNGSFCPNCGGQLTPIPHPPVQNPQTEAAKRVISPNKGMVPVTTTPSPVASQPSATQLLEKLVSVLQSKPGEMTKNTPPLLPRWKATLLLFGLTVVVITFLVGSVLSSLGMFPSAIVAATSAFGGALAAILGVLGGLLVGSLIQEEMKKIWERSYRLLAMLAGILLIGVLLLALFLNADPYLHRGMLALDDPLRDNSHGYNWSVNQKCAFVHGALHDSSGQQHQGIFCNAQSTNFSDFVYEVQMTIVKGDCGGLIFRQSLAVSNAHFYYLQVCGDGSYSLLLYNAISRYDNFAPPTTIYHVNAPVPSIHAGLQKTNLLAVAATSNGIELWANRQHLVSLSERAYTEGGFIGVNANDVTQPTEVTFSNARVWTLS